MCIAQNRSEWCQSVAQMLEKFLKTFKIRVFILKLKKTFKNAFDICAIGIGAYAIER